MATKKEKGIIMGSANPRNRAAMEAAGLKSKSKKTTAKTSTMSKKAAEDKKLKAEIDAIRKKYLEKSKKNKK